MWRQEKLRIRRELMPLRRFFKDDEKKHADDSDKQKEIEEMTEQANATLGKIALSRLSAPLHSSQIWI
nr:hypothetical protein [Tanacetum cinerariifolium]